MRRLIVTSAVLVSFSLAAAAQAVTITNADSDSQHIFVCDEQCGPSHGDDWGTARDFWLSPGQSQSFDCNGKCYVGTYQNGESPMLGDIAFADDDEMFEGDDEGFIRKGIATHKSE
jgi:hypothetical protein